MTDYNRASDSGESTGTYRVGPPEPRPERRKMQRRRATTELSIDMPAAATDRRLGLGRRWEDWRRR